MLVGGHNLNICFATGVWRGSEIGDVEQLIANLIDEVMVCSMNPAEQVEVEELVCVEAERFVTVGRCS